MVGEGRWMKERRSHEEEEIGFDKSLGKVQLPRPDPGQALATAGTRRVVGCLR